LNAAELLPILCVNSSRNPEFVYRQPWELQWLLFAMN
jgi:hypothetical protein